MYMAKQYTLDTHRATRLAGYVRFRQNDIILIIPSVKHFLDQFLKQKLATAATNFAERTK